MKTDCVLYEVKTEILCSIQKNFKILPKCSTYFNCGIFYEVAK